MCAGFNSSHMFDETMRLIVVLVIRIAFIFLPFFAPNIETILAGAILQGIPWGVFQTLTCTYASEVTPTVLRPYVSRVIPFPSEQ